VGSIAPTDLGPHPSENDMVARQPKELEPLPDALFDDSRFSSRHLQASLPEEGAQTPSGMSPPSSPKLEDSSSHNSADSPVSSLVASTATGASGSAESHTMGSIDPVKQIVDAVHDVSQLEGSDSGSWVQ